MGKLFFLIAILFIPAILIINFYPQPFINNIFSYSLCDQPIRYRIDTIDPQFHLSKEEFSKDTEEAAQIWNNAQQKQLFAYDPKGVLSINLIYDERQSLSNQINQLEDQVKSDKQQLAPQISEYQKLAADFKQQVTALNSEIEYWNNQGGAPPEEYQKIIKKQQDLKNAANRLNSMARNLNISTSDYNQQVGELNQTISTFNSALEERPEEGIYKGPENKIEIYFNINQNELIHTLAHELGHALGLAHSSDSKAIMYYKTSQSIVLSSDDRNLLSYACRRQSMLELLQNYLIILKQGVDRSIYLLLQ